MYLLAPAACRLLSIGSGERMDFLTGTFSGCEYRKSGGAEVSIKCQHICNPALDHYNERNAIYQPP